MSFEIVGTPEQVEAYSSKFNPGCLVEVKMNKNMVMHPFRFAPFSKLLPEYFKFVADPDTKLSDFMTMVAGCTSFEMIIEGSLEDVNKFLSKYNPGYVVENVRIVKNNLGHPFKFASNSELLPEYFKFVAGPETKMPDFVTILSGCINFEMKYKFGVIHYCTSRDNNMIWFEIYGNSKVSIDFLQRYIKATFESKDVIRCVLMMHTGEFFKFHNVLETSEAKPPVLQENDQPLAKRFKMEKCWKIKVQVNWEVYTVISRISAFEEAKPFNLDCRTYYNNPCTNGVVFKLSPKPGYEISDDDLIKLDARLVKEGLIVEEA